MTLWRTVLALALLALAFGLVTALKASAQAPPRPPHTFFGAEAERGSGARIDGELAPDGSVIQAFNEADDLVAEAVVGDRDTGVWVLDVNPDGATSVTFQLDGRDCGLEPLPVSSGNLDEVALDCGEDTASAVLDPGREVTPPDDADTEESAVEETEDAPDATAGGAEPDPEPASEPPDDADTEESEVEETEDAPDATAGGAEPDPEPASEPPAQDEEQLDSDGGETGFVAAIVLIVVSTLGIGGYAVYQWRRREPPDGGSTA